MKENKTALSGWLDRPVGEIWRLPVKWVLHQRGGVTKEQAESLGVDRLLLMLLKNRDIEDEKQMRAFLWGGLSDLTDPGLLPDAEKAVAVIKEALENGRSVRIIGDYDVDGITASYVLYQSFCEIYPKDGKGISVRIPDRVTDGYGLNQRLIEEAAADGIELIVTCDNGIAATESIALAKERGMTVVVTDHHEPHYEQDGDEKKQILPPADAVVDPKRYDSTYPTPEICGAVVAFKICQLLLGVSNAQLGEMVKNGARDPKTELFSEFVEICALATVCDVMPLGGENRILTKVGLGLMNHTKNTGLRQLIRQKQLDDKKLTAYHMGFLIGPCLNSSGRLESAMIGFSLLCERDEETAEKIAMQLCVLNEERKQMTEQALEQAVRELESRQSAGNVIVVYLPGCHESLAGIVAGRIRERYDRPAIVLTDADTQGMLKGSGRSVPAYDMSEGLHGAADLLAAYGGHKMAAGMTLEKEKLAAFEERLNEMWKPDTEELARVVTVDCNMPFSYISEEIISQLELLEPSGIGNRKPVFGRRSVRVASSVRIMGKNENVAKCILEEEGGRRIEAICFKDAKNFAAEANKTGKLHILYRPQINEYLSQRTLQVVVEDYLADEG